MGNARLIPMHSTRGRGAVLKEEAWLSLSRGGGPLIILIDNNMYTFLSCLYTAAPGHQYCIRTALAGLNLKSYSPQYTIVGNGRAVLKLSGLSFTQMDITAAGKSLNNRLYTR